MGVFRPCSRVLIPGPHDWAIWVASGSRGSRADESLLGGCVAYAVRVATALFVGSSGRGVPTKLPGRKFQSHPGVPPARLIEHHILVYTSIYSVHKLHILALVYTSIYSVHKLSNASFTLNQALSALRRRRFSAARSLLASFAATCLSNVFSTLRPPRPPGGACHEQNSTATG